MGIKVSAVCSQYIATPMLGFNNDKIIETKNLISAKNAATRILRGVALEKFLILTDKHTNYFFRKKSKNYEKWILGMNKLNQRILEERGEIKINSLHKFI